MQGGVGNRRPLRDLDRAGDIGERPPGFLEEGAAGRGQRDVAAVALEEADADGRLELVKLVGERRLREVEPGSGSPEVQLLCKRDERPELAKGYGGVLASYAANLSI
jgi:hypothetical protein